LDDYKWITALKHRIGGLDGPLDDSKPPAIALTLPILNRASHGSAYRRPTLNRGSSSRTSSFRSPDRFVPSRRLTTDDLTQTFRTSKEPAALSTDERLVRNSKASPDAFDPHRRASSPVFRTPRNPIATDSIDQRGRSGGSVLQGFDVELVLTEAQERAYLLSEEIPLALMEADK
jgi:hypothetical protein